MYIYHALINALSADVIQMFGYKHCSPYPFEYLKRLFSSRVGVIKTALNNVTFDCEKESLKHMHTFFMLILILQMCTILSS